VIRLYHSADARSLRCLWALEELDLPFDLDVLPFPPRLHRPDYLNVNPQGTVPTLVDGAVLMTESVAILHYLATRYGPTSLAVGVDEADYGAWLDWLHYGEATLTTPQTVVIRYRASTDPRFRLPHVEEDYAELFLARLARLSGALSDREFLCAGRFTAADISVGYALDVANYIGLTPRLPSAVISYVERLRARPAYRAARRRQAIDRSEKTSA
jgi:glutathione S-transferase